MNLNKNAKFILLIEHPKALVELEDILKNYSKCIHGIGLGSHDLSIEVGMINDIDIIRSIRINIMILAKAYNIEAIDVASMNISEKESFENEVKDGFKCGYRSKFLIHPLFVVHI
jgi:citrate lyase beta subunit